MVESTLLVSAGISVVIALVYVTVGRRVASRPVPGEARPPLIHFGMWWIAVAAITLLNGIEAAFAALDVTSLALFATIAYVNLFFIAIALVGLVYYLVYLFTGLVDTLSWIVAYYFGLFFVLVYLVSQADPTGVEATTWTVDLVYAQPPTGPVPATVLLLLLVPPMLGALGYLSLLARVEAPSQRYRIGLVSTSILLWFGSVYGASLVGLSDAAWWPLASNGIGLVAALAIWAAYLPPGWIRDRLGVEALGATGEEGVRPSEVSSS